MGSQRSFVAWGACITLFSFLVAVILQFPALSDHYVINDDVRQNTFLYQRVDGSFLFDHYEDFYHVEASLHKTPILMHLFYLTSSLFLSPLLLSKIIPLILAPLTSLQLFRYVAFRVDTRSAILVSLVFSVHLWTFSSLSGGHARAFSYLLIISFLLYSERKQYLLMCSTLVAGILIYPIAFLLCFGVYTLQSIDMKGLRHLLSGTIVKRLQRYIIITVLCASLVSGFYTFHESPLLGGPTGWETIRSHPLFTIENSDEHPSVNLLKVAYGFSGPLALLALALVPLFMYIRRRGWGRFPQEMSLLAITGIVLYSIALLMGYGLHHPDRYIRYTFPLAITFFVVLTLCVLVSRLAPQRPAVTYSVLIALGVTGLLVPMVDGDLVDCGDQRELYSRISEVTEMGEVVAGNPVHMNCIPTFARRMVLMNDEFVNVEYRQYLSMIHGINEDIFSAYYASEKGPIDSLCRAYNLSLIVVHKDDFSAEVLEDGFIDDDYEYTYWNYLLSHSVEGGHFHLHDNFHHYVPLSEEVRGYRCPSGIS